jgi:cobalt/nickel transport system ATP-binding protein
MIKMEHWSVTYPDGTEAVRDLNLTIASGEKVALIGANGAGKSSLILSLVGVLPAQGRLEVEGTTLSEDTLTAIRSQVGVVFQNPDDQLFLPTIYDDIAFGPLNQGLDEETIRHRVEDRLQLLGISHLRNRTALKLSGGEKRMAALATVLAMKPSFMILDEPTAFLDPRARRKLINVLKRLPHTMLIATHDLDFAAQLCSRSIILHRGKLFADGATGQLLRDEALMERADLEAL